MGSLCSKSTETLPHISAEQQIHKLARSRTPSQSQAPNIREYYVLGKVIGSGSFGKVRRATSILDPNYNVAVKTIERRRLKKPQNLIREVELLRLLDHPNIIKVYELFEDEAAYHIVMELCEGRELLQCMIEFGKFDEATAADLIKKILSAVNHMHKHGVCHRDLKLENFVGVAKENDTDVKLVDFGLSKKFGSKKGEDHTVVGTPFYVAPEVLTGKYGEKCDLWSCGVILYAFLSGSMPFTGDDPQDIIQSVKYDFIDLKGNNWRNISQPAKDLVSKMLERDVKKRLSAQEALKHPWFSQSSKVEIDIHIIQSLQNFRLRSSFQKEVLLLLSKTVNYAEIKKINEAFYAMDKQKVGFLTIEEIKNGLLQAGLNPVNSELKICLKNLDMNKDGKIRYSDFLVAALNSKFILDEKSIREAFSHLDQGTGKITKKELTEVLVLNNSNIEEAESILEGLKLKNKGEVTYEEFKDIFLNI